MEEKINLIISQLGDLRVKQNADLSDYLASGYKGKANAMYIATSISELIKVVNLCKELVIPFLVIGSGSKVIVSDSLYPGLIIKNRSQNLKIFGIKGQVSRSGIGIREASVEADSGVNLADLADYCKQQGLVGFEDLKQVKGTVGGSISSNQILLGKVTQISVLVNSNVEKIKETQELPNCDVILNAVFHLKAREV